MPLFGGPPDVAKLAARKDVKGLVKALGYQSDVKVRKGAAEALGRAGDPAAVVPLIAALADPLVNEDARHALVRLYAHAIEPLIAALASGAPAVRAGAASALGAIGDARAVAPLIAALSDSAGDVRCEAVMSLSLIGDVRGAGPSSSALRDRDPKVRRGAAAWFWKFGPGPWAEPLGPAAFEDPDQKVRELAFHSLAMLGDQRAVEGLIAILRGPYWVDRVDAAKALGRTGDRRAVEPLIEALGRCGSTYDHNARRAAAEALAALYQSGSLDEASKARMLAQRGAMTHYHSDYDTGCVGDGSHEHTDKGIGVDFPV